MSLITLKNLNLNLKDKRIFVRSDFNVPIKNSKIQSDARIIASLPTIKFLLKKGAKVIVASHLGRPKEGEYNKNFSLKPIVEFLKTKILNPVRLVKDYLNQGINFHDNELIILENVRFNIGEKTNNINLSKIYASFCEIFVMDAFATAHRIHASTYGISKFVSISCAGILLSNEINSLNKIFYKPKRPIIAIIGGSKVSTKLNILSSLINVVDYLILGGGLANTFFAANGYNIGKSISELKFINKSKLLLNSGKIILPIDVKVSNNFSNNSLVINKLINNINYNEMILDIGDRSLIFFIKYLNIAKTIIWNGPMGAFELKPFSKGTEIIAKTIANINAFSIAGGGDTIAAINMFNIYKNISYISTGGGAFLEYIEKKTLPCINILN